MHYTDNKTYGAFYTWCTATVGCNSETYSICPKEWKLPTRAQYDTLRSKKTGSWNNGWTLAGGFFPATGYVSGSLVYVDSYGYYWSSTANGADNTYRLGFNSSNVNTVSAYRYFGHSVRCIAP